jgi:hypothetical protein
MTMFLGGLVLRLGYLYRLSRRKDLLIYNHASFRWSMPDAWADGLTLVFLAATLFVVVRRSVRPEVRILTSA